MAKTKFRHQPLSTELHQQPIRLIKLFPGDGSSQISCTIDHVFLVDFPAYETLSYCWGDPTVTEEIFCNSARLEVTTNLFHALSHLRFITKPRILWIDAICIDQSNAEERKQQVLLMRLIYQRSMSTFIWLGRWTPDGDLAISLIPRLIHAYQEQKKRGDKRRIFEMNAEALDLYDIPMVFSSAYRALSSLLLNDWFKRMWIIQEVAASPDANISYGSWNIPWTDFACAVMYASDLGAMQGMCWNSTQRLDQVAEIQAARAAVNENKAQTLLGLLLLHRAHVASDPRDKVYALCGLLSDRGPDRLDIEPDYTLSNRDVYVKVAIAILRNSRNLDILSVPKVPVKSEVNNLLSWVPDWSVSDFSRSLRYPNNSGGYWNQHQATPGNLRSDIILDDTSNSIAISGHLVDRITVVGELYDPSTNEDISWWQSMCWRMPSEQNVYNNWDKVAGARSKILYVNGEDIIDAYWKTLVLGQIGFTTQDHAATKAAFLLWDRHFRAFMRYLPLNYMVWAFPLLSLFWYIFLGFFHLVLGVRSNPGSQFRHRLMFLAQRRICRTEKGYIGIVPRTAEKGDSVGLFKGGAVPLLLRSEDDKWELVGDAYIHGIMNGEAFVEEKCKYINII
ncbi:hypothetical protein MMC17_002778 [Xylographa soralifera]|nr:hypothetical protein [Xylographa soralifera]